MRTRPTIEYLVALWHTLFSTRGQSVLTGAKEQPNREARRAFEKSPLRDSDWQLVTTSKVSKRYPK